VKNHMVIIFCLIHYDANYFIFSILRGKNDSFLIKIASLFLFLLLNYLPEVGSYKFL